MVGLATRILVAQRTAAELKRAGAPEAAIIEAHPRWFYLGALGPALGNYVPFETPAGPDDPERAAYYTVWQQMLKIAVGDGTATPGLAPVLRTFHDFLFKVKAMVVARDFDGLKAMRDSGQLDVVQHASQDLGQILRQFADRAQLKQYGKQMGNDSRPALINELHSVPPSRWSGREWLHWKHPGRFATQLRTLAERSGDDRWRAYAMGWAVSFGTLVCGSGYMNSLVGASYRNQWWRSRWVGNFVDTWTWGYYGAKATMSASDQPTPPYEAWPGLCAARLHDLIDLTDGLDPETVASQVVAEATLPHVLPAQFTAFWRDAWNAAYGSPEPALFTADRLQVAYLMLWITLWFQTSGAVIGCNPPPPADPPAACGSNPVPPDWVDPSQTNPLTELPFTPPTPHAKHDPDVAEVVSGLILALGGAVLTMLGGASAGIAAIAGGVALMVDGERQLNWNELECQLHWLHVYLYNGLDVLHKLAVFSGMQPPCPAELSAPLQTIQFNGGTLSYVAGAMVCKSRPLEGMHLPWDGALSTWTAYPENGTEQPLAGVWHLGGLWPSAIVDDGQANPASADVLQAPGPWPGGVQGSFGPAVAAGVRLVRKGALPLPDWNLDGDRGRGWLTWQLAAPYDTGTAVPAIPEP